jgi:hypothetical protein
MDVSAAAARLLIQSKLAMRLIENRFNGTQGPATFGHGAAIKQFGQQLGLMVKIALADADRRLLEEVPIFFLGFDAFGNNGHVQRRPERLDRPENDLVPRPLMDR